MSVATVVAIFDDTGAADGTINEAALIAVANRSDQEVNSYFATNYTQLTFPVDPVPDTIKFASLEFGIVFSRDRKPEYWAKAQERERELRMKEARAKMDRYAAGKQFLYDSPEKRPKNVGGITYDNGPRTITDSADGTNNNGDF